MHGAGTVTIGGDLTVNRIGLGTNRLTDTPEAAALLHQALSLGVNFIDTANIYASTASESTIGKVLAPYPPGLVIATKGGMTPTGVDGSPKHLQEALDASLRRLKLECIDLYQLHRVDPDVPLEQTITFLKEAKQHGKIRHIGLSQVSVEQIEAAQRIAPIASVQNQYNVLDRAHDKVVNYCEQNDIVFIPYRPLGGIGNPLRQHVLDQLADKYGITLSQLALVWLLKRSPVILPIPGTLSIEHLTANLDAAKVELSGQDMHQLSSL